jgi:hypothetical protein
MQSLLVGSAMSDDANRQAGLRKIELELEKHGSRGKAKIFWKGLSTAQSGRMPHAKAIK